MAVIPRGFHVVASNDKGVLKKGDEILFIYKRPSWVLKNTPKLYETLITHSPALMDITMSANGKQHKMSLCRAWSTDNELYMVYVVTSNVLPIIIIILIVALIIALLGIGVGYLLRIAVCKVNPIESVIGGIIVLGVIGLAIFLGVKYLLRRFG